MIKKITSVRCIMRSAVVTTAASGEGKTCLQTILSNETPCCRLQLLAYLNHRHTRLDPVTDILTCLKIYAVSV